MKVRSKKSGDALQNVVIKVTDKVLHSKSVTVVKGKEIVVQENIVDEIHILSWLTRHNPPPAMTRFIEFFEDEANIFLVPPSIHSLISHSESVQNNICGVL